MNSNPADRLVDVARCLGVDPGVLSGASPVPGYSTDPYHIVGQGPLRGVAVQRFGRFGNNIVQIVNAILIARRLALGWVRFSGFDGYFQSESIRLVDGLELIFNRHSQNEPGSELSGSFFYWWGAAGALRSFSDAEFAAVVRKELSPVFAERLGVQRFGASGVVHVHIRGGDVFGLEGAVNGGYAQPPLSYYKLMSDAALRRDPETRFVVVAEDRLNPCVNALMSWYSEQGVMYEFKSGSERDDIREILSAREIIAGFGTFVPMIALLSPSVGAVSFFRNAQRAACLSSLGVSVVCVRDRCDAYIKSGEWRNSAVQRALMLEYPESCLDVA